MTRKKSAQLSIIPYQEPEPNQRDVRFRSQRQPRQSNVNVHTLILLALAATFILLDLSVSGFLYSGLIVTLLIIMMWPNQTLYRLQKLNRWAHNKPWRQQIFALVPVAVLTTIYILSWNAEPAQAAFFSSTESWMNSSFGGSGGLSTELVALIFNVLRAIFVIYLGISLARIISSARNDEDWTTLARTPLIVLVTVVLGDLLANFITGAGGTTP